MSIPTYLLEQTNDKDAQSNILTGTNICEISKIPTLKGYMNNYGTEYKIFIRRQKEHQITNTFKCPVKGNFKTIEDANVGMNPGTKSPIVDTTINRNYEKVTPETS